MPENILVGRGRQVNAIPRAAWEQHLARIPEHGARRLQFMSAEHHRVRYFVVRELPRVGAPLQPAEIARSLGLSGERLAAILDELERKLFFLVRDEGGAVSWAFPVTVEPTPHPLRFSTGERLYGA